MSAQSGLSRLAKLYGMLERVRARELGRASHAADEVRRAEEVAEAGRLADDAARRSGLAAGSWVESSAALVGQDAAIAQRRALHELGVLRTRDLASADELYKASLTELKQVETMLRSAKEEAAEVENRLIFAASDDRYLARREWLRKRALRQGA